MIDANPDVVIASWCGKKVKRQQILAREGWEDIAAIANERVYEINSTIILQPGPAALTAGVDAMAKIIRSVALEEPLDLSHEVV